LTDDLSQKPGFFLALAIARKIVGEDKCRVSLLSPDGEIQVSFKIEILNK